MAGLQAILEGSVHPDKQAPREAVAVQATPPLARRIWPLTQPLSGPVRNDTTPAMSSGCPSRSSGGIVAKCSISSGLLPFKNSSVATGPGATAFTVIRRPRSSLENTCVKLSTAALLAM
ncbi:hypothetical protein G6F65_022903 [Rhizopus arrhizus]|nr:hypothetical protein G6F65_022903 [Rhizopus arrhizus]